MTKHTATNPFDTSDIATRNSKTKVYSHVVFTLTSAETQAASHLASAAEYDAQIAKMEAPGYTEGVRAEFEEHFGNGDETAAKVPEWIASSKASAARERQRATETTDRSGAFTWASRLDLAEKQAASLMNKGRCDEVRIVEVEIV